MRTPIKYYGGKQRILSFILPKIPPHITYCEPFAGGAALFFAKPLAKCNILNDTRNDLMIFYKVLKYNTVELQKYIDSCLYSRYEYKRSRQILKNKSAYSDLEIAASFYISVNCSFGAVGNSWGYEIISDDSLKAYNKKKHTLLLAGNMLEGSYIENDDALNVIKRFDTADTFFYIDPPYMDTDCGEYNKYTKSDFELLIGLLSFIEGNFMLSHYRNEYLERWAMLNKFTVHYKKTSCTVRQKIKTDKIEMLICNFNQSLF